MLRGETFSDTETSIPSASHLHSWVRAASMTHAVSGWMIPVSSAIGMNLSGGISPSRGWFQRTRASTVWIAPVASVICGW